MKNAIWITWENQVRNKAMASALGAKLYVFSYNGSPFKRYLICMFMTSKIIVAERPNTIFAQNPSIILNYFLILLRFFFRYKLVSDAHFAGLIAYNGNKSLQKALDLCNYLADLVIVTNTEHAKYVKKIKGKAAICEDPLPDIQNYITEENENKMILYICSYDVDEPYEKVFKAAKLLSKEGFEFIATGNYKRANINTDEHPYVNFTGYLPESDFYSKIFQSNVIVDLTDNDNCLVCGAYEAMAAEKPLVTSDSECLKNYFTKGTLFTKHDEISIANAIRLAYRDRIILKKQIKEWKTEIVNHQNTRIVNIRTQLGSLF